MTTLENLELRLGDSSWILSARRIWEYGEHGQALPLLLSAGTTASQAIDLVDCSQGAYVLTGSTLANMEDGLVPKGLDPRLMATPAVQFLRSAVTAYLARLCTARAWRGNGEEFAGAAPRGPLRARGLHSRLQARLASTKGAFPPAQWLATIANYSRSGITEEEISLSGVREYLDQCHDSSRVVGSRLAQACTFPGLQLSIVAHTRAAQRQLRLIAAPPRTYRRVQGQRRLRQPGTRTTMWIDASLGYRVDRVEHEALWGVDVSWQAVDEEGLALSGSGSAREGNSKETAVQAAASDAALRYPKQIATPRWQGWCWGGGESYREWLITAPGLPVGYFSPHFDLRNVMLHFRTDVRRTATGEDVLFVQEVQSDWGQGAASRSPFGNGAAASQMPFAREWALLAAKLLLLQAASLGVEHLAWTTGEQQVRRWAGLGERHLLRFYDQSLPKAFERLLGSAPASVSIYVPVDFTTRAVEGGYQVISRDGILLGCASTLDEAWQFVPDGAREDLVSVHALSLPECMRRDILARGFPAWGAAPIPAG